MKLVFNPVSSNFDYVVLMEGAVESSLPSAPPQGTWRWVLLSNGDLYLQTPNENYIIQHGVI